MGIWELSKIKYIFILLLESYNSSQLPGLVPKFPEKVRCFLSFPRDICAVGNALAGIMPNDKRKPFWMRF